LHHGFAGGSRPQRASRRRRAAAAGGGGHRGLAGCALGGGMRVAVAGGAGYAGGELLRLLLQHPDVSEVTVTSRSQAGKPVSDVHPQLALLTEARFTGSAPHEAAAGRDVVFLALEHGESGRVMGDVLDAGPGMV